MSNSFKKTLVATGTSFVLLSSVVGFAHAAEAKGTSTCHIVYGGGEVCEPGIKFTIDKKVGSQTKGGTFVDNLSINDQKFSPGSEVAFQITVTNTGDKTINNIEVKDIIPEFLVFVSGSGNFDQSTKTLKYIISELKPGDSNTQIINARFADSNNLPQDKGIVCVTNIARATEESSTTAEDSSQVCVQHQVLGVTPGPKVLEKVPVKEIPQTGPGLLSLALLIPSGAAGLFLRKKSSL